MNTLIHDLLQYIWAVMLVIGFIISALAWIVLAIWDNVMALGRRIAGDEPAPQPDDHVTRVR